VTHGGTWRRDHLLNQDQFAVQYASDVPGSLTSAADGLWHMPTLANASLLRCIRQDGGVDICGVNTSMMYMGQAMSPFALHYEDNALFSINVLYEGAPKQWYGVPGHYAAALDDLVALTHSQGLADDHEAEGAREREEGGDGRRKEEARNGTGRPLLDKVTMLSPNLLQVQTPTLLQEGGRSRADAPRGVAGQERGIPVFGIWQRPGEFVVTFPRAYHSGFSTGFNVAEAINFATSSWVPYGISSLGRYRALGRESVRLSPLKRRLALLIATMIVAARNVVAADGAITALPL